MMKAFLLCLLAAPAIADVPVSDDYKASVETRFTAQERLLMQHISAQEEKVRVAMLAAEKATDKAERANAARFESMNEFRGQLKDQAAGFITRQEALAYMFAIGAFAAWLQRKQSQSR